MEVCENVTTERITKGKRIYSNQDAAFEQCRKIALALDTSMDYLAELTDVKTPYPRKSKSQVR